MTYRAVSRKVLRAFVFLLLALFTSAVYALITGDFGNKPVSDGDWPEGTLAIANHESRLGWWEGPPFGGGQYTFLFRGDTKTFNEALQALSKIKAPWVELHIHHGPHESFWLRDREEGAQPGEQASRRRSR